MATSASSLKPSIVAEEAPAQDRKYAADLLNPLANYQRPPDHAVNIIDIPREVWLHHFPRTQSSFTRSKLNRIINLRKTCRILSEAFAPLVYESILIHQRPLKMDIRLSTGMLKLANLLSSLETRPELGQHTRELVLSFPEVAFMLGIGKYSLLGDAELEPEVGDIEWLLTEKLIRLMPGLIKIDLAGAATRFVSFNMCSRLSKVHLGLSQAPYIQPIANSLGLVNLQSLRLSLMPNACYDANELDKLAVNSVCQELKIFMHMPHQRHVWPEHVFRLIGATLLACINLKNFKLSIEWTNEAPPGGFLEEDVDALLGQISNVLRQVPKTIRTLQLDLGLPVGRFGVTNFDVLRPAIAHAVSLHAISVRNMHSRVCGAEHVVFLGGPDDRVYDVS